MSSGMGYRASKYALEDIPDSQRERSYVDTLPLMQWATRWELNDGSMRSGWVIERGKHEAFDQAVAELNVPWFQYSHPGSKGQTPYWHLGGVHAFVLATRVESTWDMDKDLATRHGIAYARANRGTGNSTARAAVFLEKLVEIQYSEPVRLVANRSMAYGQLIPALLDHYRVIRKFQEFAGWDKPPTYYEVATALVPGELESWSGQNGTARVIPIAKKGAPEEITREYLRAHYLGRNATKWLIDRIESPGEDGTTLMDTVIDWSVAESQRIFEFVPNAPGASGSVAGTNADAKSFLAKGNGQAQAESAPPVNQLPEDLPF